MNLALQVKEAISRQLSVIRQESPGQNIHQRGHSLSPQSPLFPILQAIDHVEVAPPGFLNIFLTEASLVSQMQEVLKQKEGYGIVRTQNTVTRTQGKKSGSKNTTLSSGIWVLSSPQRVLVEYAHPNTHKAFHIGHLRNITTGESIIRLLESQGHEVIRANYQGDVGLHIAKCLYGILQVQSSKFKVQSWKDAEKLSIQGRVEYLGEMYAAGSKAFEEDEKAKEVIFSLNGLIYASAQRLARERGIDPGTTDYLALVKDKEKDQLETVYTLWKETRQWSLDYFETIYQRVGSHYDRYYFESECLAGVDIARTAVKKGVLKEDAGAVIFDGKPYGIDTRVFINSKGLPTYEGKELKLSLMETTDNGKLDRMIHVVGPEQASFFQVTFKAEELLGIVKPGVQHHLIYGWVKLKHGKMSSRSGNVVLGEWLLDEAKKEIYSILEKSTSKYTKQIQEEIAEKAAVAAVKYAFLKVGTTSEIAFDLETSVSFDGDSGPYLQYTYARCKSVLRRASDKREVKSDKQEEKISDLSLISYHLSLNTEERSVLRLLSFFPDVVAEAAGNLSPSALCTYLFTLAQAFNLFYAKHSILGMESRQSSVVSRQRKDNARGHQSSDQSEDGRLIADSSLAAFRLSLTSATSQVLKNGLYLLGIETLEKM